MYVIYKAINLINGKCYIGKTTNKLYNRIAQHKHSAIKRKDNSYFYNAIRKYNYDNFKWEVIFECDDKLVLNVMETMKIIVNHSHVSEGKGYNLTWGGDGTSGYKHTEEQNRKNSERNKGHVVPDEVREKISNSMKGITRTKEHQEKWNKSRIGHVVLDETRKKISDSMKGKIVSDETRRKMSESHKNKIK